MLFVMLAEGNQEGCGRCVSHSQANTSDKLPGLAASSLLSKLGVDARTLSRFFGRSQVWPASSVCSAACLRCFVPQLKLPSEATTITGRREQSQSEPAKPLAISQRFRIVAENSLDGSYTALAKELLEERSKPYNSSEMFFFGVDAFRACYFAKNKTLPGNILPGLCTEIEPLPKPEKRPAM